MSWPERRSRKANLKETRCRGIASEALVGLEKSTRIEGMHGPSTRQEDSLAVDARPKI